jgi:1-deoxy-D-xylulose-5-phosphate synthase
MGVTLPAQGEVLPIGRGRIMREGSDVALLSFGTRLGECLKAADALSKQGIKATVADARFAKPLDMDLIEKLIRNHALVITVEEGAAGGFGAHVLSAVTNAGLLDGAHPKLRVLTLPDIFQHHDAPSKQYAHAGLDAEHIVKQVVTLLAKSRTDNAA